MRTDLLNLRRTHPNLYVAYTVYACISIGLGLNFLFLNPTFDPLDIPKQVPGVVFLALGLTKLVCLNFVRRHGPLRLTMATAITIMFFWSGALIFDFFRLAQTSLQLPITFLGLAATGMPLLAEPPINPVTRNTS
jgi:hypothetical protein